MLEQKPASEDKAKDGETVYRRIVPGVDDAETATPIKRQGARRRRLASAHLAPTLKTVVVGFVLLLTLVILLGYLSVQKTNEVGRRILDDERRQVEIRGFTLELRISTTRLDNEARARGRKLSPETDETRPLTDARLNRERGEVLRLMRKLEKSPFSDDERWRSLYKNLALFVQATEDPEAYAREGFEKFRDADRQLDALLEETKREQEEIFYRNAELQRGAGRRIYLLTTAALLIGLLVAGYTIWEVQRRFRQMRQSMSEARREREFSAQMLEGMVSAVAAIDAHDRIRSANAAFLKIFPGAETGASVHGEFAAPGVRKMLEAATSSRVERATYRGRWVCDEDTPNCADRTFDVYSSPLVIDGEKGQIITLVDVTEAAEAESVLRRTESLAAMGQAVAQVAHEIKNPLGSIRLGVSMLRDTSRDAESQGTIDLVERGINHLNKLVVDISQFSRGRPLELSEVELNALLDSSLELISEQIQEKRTHVEKRSSREALRGKWDADQLRQVFVNLFANAIDASHEDSPLIISTERAEVVVTARTQGPGENGRTASEKTGEFARVIVEDKGAGMDERTRARIFEPFFSTKKRGSGLGLAIVKQIVERHGGAISVESAPGEGTRFTVDLPLNR